MIKKVGIGLCLVSISFILGLVGYLLIIYAGEYVIDDEKLVMNSATTIVDESGNEVTKLFVENREIVPIKKIPKHVQQAFIAVEDKRFYEHHGVDLNAILKAIYKDILAGGKVESGNTITQQLAQNLFLSNETNLRKTKELIIAINLEKLYSKQKLLEMYLNQLYFGHGAYGVQAAANYYFNKSIQELTISEGAILAAIPKSPTNYSPILQPKKAIARRNFVLQSMVQKGYITPNEMVQSQANKLSIHAKLIKSDSEYQAYIDMVLHESIEKYGLTKEELQKGGYKITVPINRNVQTIAYQKFQDHRNFPDKQDVQGSFVLLDSKSGGVLACIGGRDYQPQGINRINVNRAPGVIIQPLAVYGPALEESNLTPYSLLVNQKKKYSNDEPTNLVLNEQPYISMSDAIIQSVYTPASWTLNMIGVDTSKKYLNQLGILTETKEIVRGINDLEGISPINLAKAYRAFAENGKMVEPYFISKIEDRNGKVVGESDVIEKQIFSKQTAWYMTRMLESAIEEGTGKVGQYLGALAGKTSSDSYQYNKKTSKDAWFVGYTPNIVGVIWMGYDYPSPTENLTKGNMYATKLFKEILNDSVIAKPKTFIKPDDVEELEKPIRLHHISNLFASVSFHPLQMFTIKLEWDVLKDPRIIYRIYEKNGKNVHLINSVKGEGNYLISKMNIFSIPSYYVVPFNSQTGQEGEASNIVMPKLFSNLINKSRELSTNY